MHLKMSDVTVKMTYFLFKEGFTWNRLLELRLRMPEKEKRPQFIQLHSTVVSLYQAVLGVSVSVRKSECSLKCLRNT